MAGNYDVQKNKKRLTDNLFHLCTIKWRTDCIRYAVINYSAPLYRVCGRGRECVGQKVKQLKKTTIDKTND